MNDFGAVDAEERDQTLRQAAFWRSPDGNSSNQMDTIMTHDEIHAMPKTRRLMRKEEFAAWIANRKEIGARVDIDTAELGGWWAPEGDPYGLLEWGAEGEHVDWEGLPEHMPYFFVRGPGSLGWVHQDDLPDDKRVAMQVRLDEHEREGKKFNEERKAAGQLIDIETCVIIKTYQCDEDPYNVKLAPYPQWGSTIRVRDEEGGWIDEGDLPLEKFKALHARIERERAARIIDDLFDTLRRGGDLDAADATIRAAEKVYGERIVKDALHHSNHHLHHEIMNSIGGLMIQRGYLTMEHITELLNREAAMGSRQGCPDS